MKVEERRKKLRRGWTLFGAALALILVTLLSVLLYRKYAPSTKRVDIREYYTDLMKQTIASEAELAAQQGIEPEEADESLLQDGEMAVILQDHALSRRALWLNDTLYLDYEVMRKDFYSRFYWDETNKMMLFTTADDTWEIPLGSRTYRAGGAELTASHPVVVMHEGRLYFDTDFLQPYVNMEFTCSAEAFHVMINYQWGSILAADVKKGCVMRLGPSIKQPIVTDLEKGSMLRILDEEAGEGWQKAVTEDGFIGYVRSKDLEKEQERELTREYEPIVIPDQCLDEKVGLVWHMITHASENASFEEAVQDMSGVNVISPTWLRLADNEGNVTSIADAEYVEKAHRTGLQVWALVDNFSDATTSSIILASTQVRKTLVSNLVGACLEAGVDGLNLDLEYISYDMGYDYVQFVRELSVACRKNDLILSVDIPVPMPFNQYFDRAELGAFADYVIIMGYDEHYYGSEIGTSASLSFEENGITGTLESVPARKIISGIPFFNRLWYTYPDGSVTSEEISMARAQRYLEEYQLTPDWDNENQQNYIAWENEEGALCQLWLEDARSIGLKANLAAQYDLGGAAAWMLTQETDDVWPIFEEALGISHSVKAVLEAEKKAQAESERKAQEESEKKAQEESEKKAREEAEKKAKEEAEKTAGEPQTEAEKTRQAAETESENESEAKS